MKKSLGHILAAALSSLIFLSSCGKDEADVIPRGDLARIYAEMLMTDQWILDTPNIRLIADTSLVYEPILERYGYNSADYRKSVDRYMDDPERFARILRESGEILGVRLKELEARKAELLRLEKLRLKAEKFMPDIRWEEIYPHEYSRPFIARYDSVTFEVDSAWMYSLVYVERTDTVYEGVRMVLKDTAAVVIEAADTLAAEKPDTLSLPKIAKERKMVKPDFLKLKDEAE